ncbi:hypothetical protein GCM10022243_18290 [Saccharothrix violaceirubra]|uniref:Branched-chain amino acid transport system permease protein n=1 Tax=Saccharothrix violaceirubra TaxID=413306 RepID=A0A7W7T2B0_9PSEU|nr:ATP-binding cassette domain-containing protein [Saccharothrix violaceirubra]MBB4965264.1 branched-chain amino acid transport system permease protein [Saccharothrix violaceirubra]
MDALLRRSPHPLLPGLLLAVVATAVIASTASSYVLFLAIGAAVNTVYLQSYGLITGRAGVLSLCQLSFAGIGAYVVGWAHVVDVPGGFAVWLLLGGLAAVVAGLLIGLPALRLRGVNLAVATFAFAMAVDVVLAGVPFPGREKFDFVPRPAGFTDDAGYFVFTMTVVTALAVGLWFLDRSRTGGALVEIRHSERAAAAHGISVVHGKLTAFALSAGIAGIGGGLMAGRLGVVSAISFSTFASVTLFAIAVFVGTHNVEGAIAGGLLGVAFPVLIDTIGVPQDLAALFFAVGAVQVLRLGMSQTDLLRAKRRRRRVARAEAETDEDSTAPILHRPVVRVGADGWPVRDPDAEPALEVRNVTVRFGALTAVDDVSLIVPKGHVVGLVGPNGAGKSTLVNTVTGFTDRYTGTVLLDGRPVDKLPAHLRARAGLRRGFQQSRVPTSLDVGLFLRVAAGRPLTSAEVDEQLSLFGCPGADTPMETVDVATRRLLEVAGLALGRPPVLLLDEPAAGQSSAETRLLKRRISEIPERYGTAVLLVEHDLELVRSTCDSVVVMDFGRVVASGPPDDVLRDPVVVSAYLGTAALPTPDPRRETTSR